MSVPVICWNGKQFTPPLAFFLLTFQLNYFFLLKKMKIQFCFSENGLPFFEKYKILLLSQCQSKPHWGRSYWASLPIHQTWCSKQFDS